MKLCVQEGEATVDALMHDTHPLRMNGKIPATITKVKGYFMGLSEISAPC